MRTRGNLIILSAPSGAGKTSLSRALFDLVPNLAVSTSYTTRAARPGERHGVDYFFVDREEFKRMIKAHAFLEHAEVFGNLYGTSHAVVEALLRQGKHVTFDIDWQGARSIKAQVPSAKTIFIFPPSLAELERRLQKRGQDDKTTIEYRMRRALNEMSHYREFDYLLINDDFDCTLRRLAEIVQNKPGAAGQALTEVDPALRKALESMDKNA